MPRGYDRVLYILPFDHRGSFQAKMFGWKSPLSEAQTAEIRRAKEVIYDGINAVLASGLPKEKTGILVDEQFGAGILRDASSKNIITACPAEKSGQEEFDFEYGEDFARHIEAFDPIFCKVLVRYNARGDRDLNKRQATRLKRLSEFLAAKNRSRFMFELLVPAEKTQLEKLNGDKATYDPLVAWRSKKVTREQTVGAIAKRYREFVDLFERANTRLPSELSDRTRSGHYSSKEA